MKVSGLFNLVEYAQICRTWELATTKSIDDLDERQLARDWCRSDKAVIHPNGIDEFDPVDDIANDDEAQREERQNPRGFYTLPLEEVVDSALEKASNPLVKGLLDCDTLAVLYGPSNSGKTFVALDVAASIVSGTPWNGRPVEQGAVVYIAAEGGTGVYKRLAVLVKGGRVSSKAPLRLAPCSVDLSKAEADVSDIIKSVKFIEATDQPVRLIIVDTLARAFGDGNENDGADMQKIITNTNRIRRATGATVLLVHHTGKDASKGSRGHSSLKAAIDTELEIKPGTGKAPNKLKSVKQRDGEQFPSTDFTLEPIALGEDSNGYEVSSCIVDWSRGPKPASVLNGRKAGEFEAVLVEAYDVKQVPIEWNEWCEGYYRSVDVNWRPGFKIPKNCSRTTVERHRDDLLKHGVVVEVKPKYYMPVTPGKE